MNITLLKSVSERNRIGKKFTSSVPYTCILKSASSIINPIIQIKDNVNIVNYNYAYIADFKRYYFIDNITSIANGLWVLELSIDVLETYKNEIRKCTAIVERSTSNYIDKYLPSDAWVANVKTTTTIKQFPNGLSDTGEFILITAGG